MNTLEKLCRAACEFFVRHGETHWVDSTLQEAEANGHRLSYDGPIDTKELVFCILSALEDPSDAMVEAGLAAPDSGWTDVELKSRFTAMIRKAKEG